MTRKRILIVDDDAEMADFMREVLQNGPYEVIVAHDGVEAVDHSNRQRVDLILMDLCLPVFSGFWFCRAFKEKPTTCSIPVLVVSGLTAQEDVDRALEMGACGYLKKPFRAAELLQAVVRALAA